MTVNQVSRIYDLYYTKKNAGTKWYKPKPIYSSPETASYRPRLAMADDGKAIVIWQEGTIKKGSWVQEGDTVQLSDLMMNGHLMMSRFDGNETWSEPVKLAELNEDFCLKDYRVAYDGTSAFIVARRSISSVQYENVGIMVDGNNTVTKQTMDDIVGAVDMHRVGHIDNYEAIDLPGYLSVRSKTEVERMKNVEGDIIKWTEVTSANVVLEKVIGAAAYDDFIVNSNQQSYFSPIPLTNTALGANVFEKLRAVNGVSLPETIDSIAFPQRHEVQQAIVLSNDLSGCAMKDNALYDMNRRLLLTAIKSPTTLTIHQEYADSIADYAFENMTGLKKLYVDTWVEAGREVDDGENRPPVLKLKGEHAFDGCPEDLDIFIKDGTQYQLFLGVQASGGYGYSNADYWNLFYSDYQDVPNHMFTYFPVSRNAGHMSTLMLGYPVELPEGVTAWWAEAITSDNDTKKVTLKKLGRQIVPALMPVLLTYGGTGPLYLTRYDGPNPGAATEFENNLFKALQNTADDLYRNRPLCRGRDDRHSAG